MHTFQSSEDQMHEEDEFPEEYAPVSDGLKRRKMEAKPKAKASEPDHAGEVVSSIAVRRRKVEVFWRMCRRLFQCLCFAGSRSYPWWVMKGKTVAADGQLFADIVILENFLIMILLLTLVLGLTGRRFKNFWISPWSCRSHASNGASFSTFSTVSVSSPVASSLAGAVGPLAPAVSGAAIEECRQDPEFGLERMLRVKAQKESPLVPESAIPGAETVPVFVGKSKGINEMHEVHESELSKSASIAVAVRTTSVIWTMV